MRNILSSLQEEQNKTANNETQKLQSWAEAPYDCAHPPTLADSSGLK